MTYKSKFEEQVSSFYDLADYETIKLKYTLPPQNKKYIPDFPVTPNLFIETKGIWDAADRAKMLLIIETYPKHKFIMYFMNAHNKIHKKSPTTYAAFCDKHGIEWYCWRTKRMPKARLEELKEQYGNQENN